MPPAPLDRALEAHTLALPARVNARIRTDGGTSTATAGLLTAGADSDLAAARVHHLRGTPGTPQ
ncbi:hypothetical protein ABTY98_00085 [Streptomyces sp. NPDC096040]|uniref:hypothetical protein n=1 Tax=Streptomyces sp. NPDC096040 TaxID=3155541 RepID=UPI00331E4D95